MPKRYHIRLIRARRAYILREIVEVLGVHIRTVQDWVKSGLPVLEGSHPRLVLGHQLREFLTVQQKKRKTSLAEGEIYCLVCKIGVRPKKIQILRKDKRIGHDKRMIIFRGQCPVCGRSVNRFGSEPWAETVSEIEFSNKGAGD